MVRVFVVVHNSLNNLGNLEFGFNIVGGIDQEHIPGDPGIFVSMIRNGGSASRDGRLMVGDRIIAVIFELGR